MSKIESKWNSEFKDQESLTSELIFPCSWIYEIAPNKEDDSKNIVSKRCIISKENAIKYNLDLTCGYFATEFLSHFNQ